MEKSRPERIEYILKRKSGEKQEERKGNTLNYPETAQKRGKSSGGLRRRLFMILRTKTKSPISQKSLGHRIPQKQVTALA